MSSVIIIADIYSNVKVESVTYEMKVDCSSYQVWIWYPPNRTVVVQSARDSCACYFVSQARIQDCEETYCVTSKTVDVLDKKVNELKVVSCKQHIVAKLLASLPLDFTWVLRIAWNFIFNVDRAGGIV